MRLSSRLLAAAVKDMKKKKKKKKKKEVGRRTSIVKASSAATYIPEEILVEILVRLPADSLMRFKCVSKFWLSLISSKYFTDLFLSSTMRARRLFMYAEKEDLCMSGVIPILFSSSLINMDSAACFPQLNHHLNFPGNGIRDRFYFVSALRGLMCFAARKRPIRIINLTTRQVLNVPCPKSNTFGESKNFFEWNYFGYDPVNNEYKLVRTTGTSFKKNLFGYEVRSETQVLVLGAGASWRNTKCFSSPQSHIRPWGRGVSINAVLYCGAWSHMHDKLVLISFDFSSEEFKIIEVPIEVHCIWKGSLSAVNLMNYQDQVAIIDDLLLNNTECSLSLWVLEDAGENKWSNKTFVLLPYPQLKLTFKLNRFNQFCHQLRVEGTSRSGEVNLCKINVDRNEKSTHALYDLEKNHIIKKVVIELPCRFDFLVKTTLWEDIENIMYLEA